MTNRDPGWRRVSSFRSQIENKFDCVNRVRAVFTLFHRVSFLLFLFFPLSIRFKLTFSFFPARDNLRSFVMFSIRSTILKGGPRLETGSNPINFRGKEEASFVVALVRRWLERGMSMRNFQQNRWKRLFHSIFFSNFERFAFDILQFLGPTRWFLTLEKDDFYFNTVRVNCSSHSSFRAWS